jgi:hypothetical protein
VPPADVGVLLAAADGERGGVSAEERDFRGLGREHLTAVLAPTPRGSQLTMSYSRRSFFGKNPIHDGSCTVPSPPGPPGLKKITPWRAGPVAEARSKHEHQCRDKGGAYQPRPARVLRIVLF